MQLKYDMETEGNASKKGDEGRKLKVRKRTECRSKQGGTNHGTYQVSMRPCFASQIKDLNNAKFRSLPLGLCQISHRLPLTSHLKNKKEHPIPQGICHLLYRQTGTEVITLIRESGVKTKVWISRPLPRTRFLKSRWLNLSHPNLVN